MKLREVAPFSPDMPQEQDNPTDVISVDVPLLIRLLEYAKEDAKTDMDLHNVATKMVEMSGEGKTLSMQDYDAIVGGQSQDQSEELPPEQGMMESTYEMYFGGNKIKRFQAASKEEAQKKAREAGAKSVVRVTKDGMPVGKIGNNLLKGK